MTLMDFKDFGFPEVIREVKKERGGGKEREEPVGWSVT